jgi:hypothetical protein
VTLAGKARSAVGDVLEAFKKIASLEAMRHSRNMKLTPEVHFDEDRRLMVFRPRGILDAKAVIALVRFLEEEEDRAHEPFNRFTDTSKLDALDLDERFVYRIALHRRQFYAGRAPVKSAFYITSAAAARYVEIHAIATEHSPLQVEMFKELDRAAAWLGVPRNVLEE